MPEVAGLWKTGANKSLFAMQCRNVRGHATRGQKGMPICYMEGMQKGIPPPICGAARAFYPHNFPHQKYSKKSPWPDWKKFRKKFVGKCFGGKGKPPILWKGGEVLKYERLVYVCKDSGIIRECKRIVLSFCFRTIEPCLCLVGRCLCVLLSFGT